MPNPPRLLPGLLLTGGASRRMGTPKANLLLDGETLARRAGRALASVCAPVLEVGPGHTDLPAVLEEPRGGGPVAALVAGWDALDDPPAVLLVACDLPFLDVGLLRALAELPGTGPVVPVAAGRPQPTCARYDRRARDEAASRLRRGSVSFHSVLDALDVVYLDESRWGEVAGPNALVDVDTPEEAARWGVQPPR
jgi:molybdopterin-guanine dinucleotide biosynthesis protein A